MIIKNKPDKIFGHLSLNNWNSYFCYLTLKQYENIKTIQK